MCFLSSKIIFILCFVTLDSRLLLRLNYKNNEKFALVRSLIHILIYIDSFLTLIPLYNLGISTLFIFLLFVLVVYTSHNCRPR